VDAALGIGLVLGAALAIPLTTTSVLLLALWRRRARSVAVAALLGVAVTDGVLAASGIAIGTAIGGLFSDAGLRATVAAGLLVGVCGWIAFRLLFGPPGVAANAVLPDTAAGAFARFAAVALFDPLAGFATAAVSVARPEVGRDALGPIVVAGLVAGGLASRGVWIATGAGRSGARSARWSQVGLGLAGILLIAWVALRIGP
jgi:hypothetical protein